MRVKKGKGRLRETTYAKTVKDFFHLLNKFSESCTKTFLVLYIYTVVLFSVAIVHVLNNNKINVSGLEKYF